jgi:phosphoglycolate phosphatase-like HAD superfamily hydrolase
MLVVVDIDQCISDGRRRALVAGAEPDRTRDVARYNTWRDTINAGIEHDDPVPGMRELVAALTEAGHDVVYVTARGSSLRGPTRDWLKAHDFPDLLVIMRAETDFRKSCDYKEWAINKMLTSDHQPVLVLDDDERGELEAVCKRRGWTFLKAVSCAV